MAGRLSALPSRLAVARIAIRLGALSQWDCSELEAVADEVNLVLAEAGLPDCTDTSDETHKFYAELAAALGWPDDYGDDYNVGE